jgi:hypothetical protein
VPGAGRTRKPRGLKRKMPTSQYRQADTTGTPCAMVLRLLRALPGVPGLIASVANGFHSLDPSVGGTGPRGLTVRDAPHVLRHNRVHRSPHHES